MLDENKSDAGRSCAQQRGVCRRLLDVLLLSSPKSKPARCRGRLSSHLFWYGRLSRSEASPLRAIASVRRRALRGGEARCAEEAVEDLSTFRKKNKYIRRSRGSSTHALSLYGCAAAKCETNWKALQYSQQISTTIKNPCLNRRITLDTQIFNKPWDFICVCVCKRELNISTLPE